METSSIPRQSLLAQMAEGVRTTAAGETAVATGQEELCRRRRCHCSGLERPSRIVAVGQGIADLS